MHTTGQEVTPELWRSHMPWYSPEQMESFRQASISQGMRRLRQKRLRRTIIITLTLAAILFAWRYERPSTAVTVPAPTTPECRYQAAPFDNPSSLARQFAA